MRLILYSKPGCCLCDEARTRVDRLRARGYDLELDEYDITADETAFERYRYTIPVIELPDGRQLAAPISEYKLEKLLTKDLPSPAALGED